MIDEEIIRTRLSYLENMICGFNVCPLVTDPIMTEIETLKWVLGESDEN